jgi:predicted flap endonuclease-1-like 5' DNA nuclease
MIVCPRCNTENSAWERRCKACWLRFDAALRTQDAALRTQDAALRIQDAALRTQSEPSTQAAVNEPDASAAGERRPLVQEPLPEKVTAAEARDLRSAPDEDAQHRTLAQLLGIEVAHVRALADNGIHTLEHVAESIPEQIGRALRAWKHIDPAAVIAQARRLLDLEPAPTPAPRPGREAPQHTAPGEPDPAGWWKMT